MKTLHLVIRQDMDVNEHPTSHQKAAAVLDFTVIFAYYRMQICVSVEQLDLTIFEGLIAVLEINI